MITVEKVKAATLQHTKLCDDADTEGGSPTSWYLEPDYDKYPDIMESLDTSAIAVFFEHNGEVSEVGDGGCSCGDHHLTEAQGEAMNQLNKALEEDNIEEVERCLVEINKLLYERYLEETQE